MDRLQKLLADRLQLVKENKVSVVEIRKSLYEAGIITKTGKQKKLIIG